MNEFYSWGLPIGRIAGIRVRIHWLLLAFWVMQLSELYSDGFRRGELLLWWLLTTGIIFVAILLHEFGHAFAARAVGGDAEDILMWPLGGLAFCSAPNVPRSQFIVAAGGPAVTLGLILFSWIAFTVMLRLDPSLGDNVYVGQVRRTLVNFQLILLIFNLVPLYPLDGGRIFHSLLWGWMSKKGAPGAYGRATLITIYVSRGCAIVGALFAIVTGEFWLVLILIWAWFGTEQLYVRLREGEIGDDTFGYDFSRGYTSLEGSRRRTSDRPSFLDRLRQRRAEASEATPEERRELDALLKKIQEHGMMSLTRKERRFLHRVSKRMKRH